MKLKQHGSFLVPEGTDIEDLGGKAQRLIEYQDLARKHGFHFPNAVALPWQTFADVAKRKGIDTKSGLVFENYPEIKPEDFNDSEKAIIQEVISRIDFPFFSSSAPGEDSFKARMPGAYESKTGLPKRYVKRDREQGLGNLDITLEEECVNRSCDSISEVLASYFYPFPTGLRRKHGIDDTGMGVLTREVVGGERGPRYSLVIQTNHPDGVYVGVTEGYGEILVSGKGGDLYRFDPEKKSFDRDVKWYSFTLERIVQMVLAFEKDLDLPDDFGGDYELAVDRNLNVHLLQCPPLKKIRDVGDVPKEGNLLTGIQAARGCDDVNFDKIIYSREIMETRDPKIEELFYLNQRNSNYLLILQHLPDLFIPEVAYNAAGIVEFYGRGDGTDFSPRGRAAVDHYITLLQTEKIGFVGAKLSKDFDVRFFGEEVPKGIHVLDGKGRFKVNEIRGQAGLYIP